MGVMPFLATCHSCERCIVWFLFVFQWWIKFPLSLLQATLEELAGKVGHRDQHSLSANHAHMKTLHWVECEEQTETVVTGGDLSDPVRVFADQVPCVSGKVARDRHSVADAISPPIAWCPHISATTCCEVHTHTHTHIASRHQFLYPVNTRNNSDWSNWSVLSTNI